jgi:hypothetical protein
MKRLLPLLLLLSIPSVWLVNARKTVVRIRHDDRPGIMLMRDFGFGKDPHLDVEVSNIQVHTTGQTDNLFDREKLSFRLIGDRARELEEEPFFRMDQEHRCDFLNAYASSPLFSFSDFNEMINAKESLPPYSYHVSSSNLGKGNGGQYALFFANCIQTEQMLVSFDISIDAYNMMPGGTKSYLSVGEEELPTLYLVRPP